MKEFNKKVVSIPTFMKYYLSNSFNMINLIRRKKYGVSEHFSERIMLTCTEVTGCAMCSNGHGKMALEMGMKDEEISNLLSGDTKDVPRAEAVGIAYAIAYADNDGKPGKEAEKKLFSTYGKKKAKSIKSVCSMISFGNSMGISFAILKGKLKGEKPKSSFFGREIIMYFLTLAFIPLTLVLFLIGSLFNLF